MTPTEIITLARSHFGEPTPLTVDADTARDYLNASIRELYEDLPPDRLKGLLTEESVTLTAGEGDIDPTWDKIVELYVDGLPAHAVGRESIAHNDYNQFFESPVPIFHLDDSHVWVRPTTSTVEVVHIDPPAELVEADDDVEFTDIEDIWHPALADLVAMYMYAQEEDAQQSELYRNAYQQKLGMLLAPEPAQ